MATETDALATRGGIGLARVGDESPLPVFSGKQMSEAFRAYKELQDALDKAMPDAIMELDGKKFRKKNYWRGVAVAFNLTVDTVEERRDTSGHFHDGRENFGYVISKRATAPNGRTVTSDGACFAVEKARRFKCPHPETPGSTRTLHFPHNMCPDFDPEFQWRTLPADATEHNVRGHASTRAFNRAVSDLVGFGEVSAEEVQREEESTAGSGSIPPAGRTGAAADGSVLVTNVTAKSGTSAKTKKPWTSFTISFDNGTTGSTFDTFLADEAQEAKATGRRVRATLEANGQYTNLTALEFVPVAQAEAPADPDTEPVGEPEKILTVRMIKTKAGPRWVIQSDKRAYDTNNGEIATGAEAFRVAGAPALFEFRTAAGHHIITEMRGVNPSDREPGSDDA